MEDESDSLQQGVMLKELKHLSKSLPKYYQQQCTENLLAALADALLDGTVFEIVKGLQDIQRMTEKDLFKVRCAKVQEQKALRQATLTRHTEALQASRHQPQMIPLLQSKQRAELIALDQAASDDLKQTDIHIVHELDHLVAQQQGTMEKAGVPGFLVSNKPLDVRLQMYLVDFILVLRDRHREASP